MYSLTTTQTEITDDGRTDDPTIHASVTTSKKHVDGALVDDLTKPPEIWLRFDRGNLALCLSLVEAGKVAEVMRDALAEAATKSWAPADPPAAENAGNDPNGGM